MSDQTQLETRQSTPFWHVARQPRMLALLVVFLAAAGVCGRLGAWQIDRAQQRGHLAAEQRALEAAAAGPQALGEVLAPQHAFSGNLVGRTVWVEGRFEPDGQLLVADRVHDGRTGFLVLTPFRVTDDGTSGASWASLSGAPVIPVVRGWVPDAGSGAVGAEAGSAGGAAAGDAGAAGSGSVAGAAALEVPDGVVRLTGYLQASESAGPGGLPAGQTDSISSGALVNSWGGPIYSAYLVLSSSQPSQVSAADGGPALMPRPTLPGGEEVNVQNAFYALQWFVFGAFALFLWVRSVRDVAAGGPRRGAGGIAGLPEAAS